MDYANLPLGLRVQTQIPLDVKEYAIDEFTLQDLGPSDNLAYTYTQGLVVYCVAEKTRWEWRENTLSEQGLLSSDFTYPSNVITFGIDYSNRSFNFFPFNALVPPLKGIGFDNASIVIRDRDENNFGEPGFRNIDFSRADSLPPDPDPAYEYGAKGWYTSILNGLNQRIGTTSDGSIIGGGRDNSIYNGQQSGIFSGGSNVINGGGEGYFIGSGIGNDISEFDSSGGESAILTGTSNSIDSPRATILNGRSGLIDSTGEYGLIGTGEIHVISAKYGLILQGFQNKVSGVYGTVINGSECEAKGISSIVLNGGANIADSYSEISGGTFGTTYVPVSRTSFNIADRILNIGIGTSTSVRKDGLSLFKNGVATLPTVTNALITAASPKAIVTKEYLGSIAGLQNTIDFNGVIQEAIVTFDTDGSISFIPGNGAWLSGTLALGASTNLTPTTPVSVIGMDLPLSAGSNQLQFYHNKTLFLDEVNSRGIEYSGDYEANFTNRSLVTKQYVDTATGSNTINEGWIAPVEVLHGLPGDLLAVSGDITVASITAQTGGYQSIRCTMVNPMPNTNYRVAMQVQSLSDFSEDTSYYGLVFGVVSTTQFDIAIREQGSASTDLKIHIQVIKY